MGCRGAEVESAGVMVLDVIGADTVATTLAGTIPARTTLARTIPARTTPALTSPVSAGVASGLLVHRVRIFCDNISPTHSPYTALNFVKYFVIQVATLLCAV